MIQIKLFKRKTIMKISCPTTKKRNQFAKTIGKKEEVKRLLKSLRSLDLMRKRWKSRLINKLENYKLINK